MSLPPGTLPSWRPGAARDAVTAFLERAETLPVESRLAVFDNDGTLWVERPSFLQLEFFLDALRRRAAADPALARQPEFDALLSGDRTRIGQLGLERLAVALAGLFTGQTPDQFAVEARAFVAGYTHPQLNRSVPDLVYRPMLELIDALRERQFTIAIVTGGGADFVRAISAAVYGVPPELVVGTAIEYDYHLDDKGAPVLVRTGNARGAANEGAAKATNVLSQLGRTPLLAAGNSSGDADLLHWTTAHRPEALALVVDHDDADREYAYAGAAVTFEAEETFLDQAARLGWTRVSMRQDWTRIFGDPAA